MHRVDCDAQQGRLGPCLVCMAKLEEQHSNRPAVKTEKQGSLF